MTTTIPNVEHVPNNNTSVTPVAREYEADVVVDARDETAEDVVTLTLREIRHHPLPRWEPGAHVDLLLPDGLTWQYSLCGDPADHHLWRIGVLRERPGPGGSAYVHDRLYAGTPIRVRGPRNHFPLLPSPRYLFIAGGIGITPIMPMIAAAEAAGAKWDLVYGGRRRLSMAFLNELAGYGHHVTVWPQDETGLLDLDSLLGTPRADTLIYCCGPEPLLGAVEERSTSWPGGSLRTERFTAKPLTAPVLGESFEVVLQQSGLDAWPGGVARIDTQARASSSAFHAAVNAGEQRAGHADGPPRPRRRDRWALLSQSRRPGHQLRTALGEPRSLPVKPLLSLVGRTGYGAAASGIS